MSQVYVTEAVFREYTFVSKRFCRSYVIVVTIVRASVLVADAFNADHIPDKNGGRWYGRTVKNILENSVYQTVAAVAGQEAA